MMQTNQRRSLPLLKVAVHRIANLLVQLIQGIGLGMNRLAHGAGTIGAILRFLHNEQNLVHGTLLIGPFWQRSQGWAPPPSITSLGALTVIVA
jgi:hypothetical protein